MNVIERIERWDLHLLAVDKGYNIIADQSKGSAELAELLRLAKLGAAAEEVIKNCDSCATDCICSDDWAIDDDCHDCEWYGFCKLRKEG